MSENLFFKLYHTFWHDLHSLQVLNFAFLNKRKAIERVKNGKPANIRDLSMSSKYEKAVEKVTDNNAEASTSGAQLGDNAFLDLTDSQNDEVCHAVQFGEFWMLMIHASSSTSTERRSLYTK